MNNHATLRNLLILLGFFLASPAHAYIGPGVGLSAIGTVIAFIAGMLMLIVGFVWYPFKRLYKRVTAKSEEAQDADPASEEESALQSRSEDEPGKQ
jgi:hypothetical protein